MWFLIGISVALLLMFYAALMKTAARSTRIEEEERWRNMVS